MAIPGDIDIQNFTISSSRGTIDLASGSPVKLMGFNIYESAFDYHTFADINILDENDALGQYNLSGDETVQITFAHPGASSPANFTFSMLHNSDMHHLGAMKSKEYQLRICSSELLNAHSTMVSKSYNSMTHDIIKDVIQNFLKSSKSFVIGDMTKGMQRYIANSVTPHQVFEQLKDRHVSGENESSSYTLFETRDSSGNQIYMFTTFEQLMTGSASLKFQQDGTIGSKTTTTADDFTNILSLHLPSSFFTPPRFSGASAQNSYNMHTGKQQKISIGLGDFNFKTLGKSMISQVQTALIDGNPIHQKPLRHTFVDPSNDKQKTNIAEMKPKKAAFMALLMQNTMIMKVPGNTDIKVGDVVNVTLPKKADGDSQDLETQMNGDVLVTRLRHLVRPIGQQPRYTCIAECVKAGYEEGV